jgi:multicomponent Na+:H+ antiporter subunit A
MPLHFWLPNAMAAPAPVSAYLHSATMVKAGVFLLALVHPVLGGTPLWHFSLLGVGAITMTWGAVIAAMQTDLKRVLAFSTVSALGTMVMLLGIEHDLAAKAVIVFLIVHALYKAALFMVVGVLEKTTGIRDVTQLRGLFKAMPMLAIAAALAAASMSGLPPFIGFIAKELLYELKLEAPAIGWSLLVCGVIANAANIVVALNVGISPFLRRDQPDTPLVKPPTFMLAFGPAVLGLMSLLFGIFPSSLGGAVSAAATQIQAEPVAVKLKLWHGFNLVLLLSAVTVMLGLVGYTMRRRLWAMGVWLSDDVGLSGQAAFRRGFAASLLGFDRVTRLFQSGDLKRYHMTIALAVIAAIAGAWWSTGYVLRPLEWTAWRAEALIPVGLICASAVCLIFARTRMTAVLLLGCVGFGISALFAVYGAPDLAITQLLVETLTLVLFALAIYGLPKMETERNRGFERWATMGLAGALGLCFFLLTLKALDVQWQEPISTQIAERSVPDGYGRNIVNVILVDFRSLDTLGEIAVLLIAALGVASMLGGMRSESSPLVGTRRSPVLAASARYTAPAMIFISIYLLLRGHNDPGGGFIGGLVAAMSSVLVHLAHPNKALTLLRMRPTTLASVGLALAGLSGLPGLLMKDSFLDAIWGPSFWLPLVGKVKIGTPLLFDIGVYAVVAGIVLLLYGQMEARHTNRQHRAARAAQGGV